MASPVEIRSRIMVPVSRSTTYRLLSQVFKDPTLDFFEELRSGDFLSELWDNMSDLHYMLPYLQSRLYLLDKTERELRHVAFEEFAAEYTRIFAAGVPLPVCSPLEGLQEQSQDREALLLQVSAFYRQFGLVTQGRNGSSKPADHLSTELEFLHYLAFKEAQAVSTSAGEARRGYILAQRDFLQNHLTHWMPKFCRRLEASCRISFFGDLAATAADFVAFDYDSVCSRLELES